MQPPSGGSGKPAPAPTRFAVAHPWTVLTAWAVAVAVLGMIGLGIDGRLSSSGLQITGSQSAKARALIGGNFGDSATVPVLLRGPRAAVKTQGKALAATLAKRPGVRVLSPWTASSSNSALRPSADRALLLLSISGSGHEIDQRSQAVQRVVARATSAPVKATVTGLPLLTRDGMHSSLAAIHRAELIALPLLLLALLLVFRSPLAAAIPVAFGAATIAAATGALALLASVLRLDAFALAISCMVGMALAVDYSLLLVSRLREELADGDEIGAAVARATTPTTRTVAAAAAAIVVAMGVAAAMSPGTSMLGAALGVSVVALLAAGSAMLAVPAMLVLLGPWLGSEAAAGKAGHGLSAGLARAAMHRPALAAGAALLLLAASVPVLGLRASAPQAQSLPSGSSARTQYDTVSSSMGPGWTEPFEIVAVAHQGAVTTAPRLAALERVQRKLARDPAVRAVLGPGTIARSAAALRSAGRRAVAAQRGLPQRTGTRLKRLGKNVNSAADGVDSLRSSLSSANAATSKIQAGSKDLQGGVGSLQRGLSGAGSGARQLAAKLADAGRGANGLASQSAAAGGGARKLRDGARELSSGLATLASSLRDLQGRLHTQTDALSRAQSGVRAQNHQADAILASAVSSLPPTSTAAIRARAALALARQALSADPGVVLDDPVKQLGQDAQYAGAIADATPVSDAAHLATAVGDLADSADAIAKRVRNLDGTVGSLTDGGASLVSALKALDGGANRIGAAVSAVGASVNGLASGVRSGATRSGALASGLQDASSAVRGLSGSPSGTQDATPQKSSATFFDSGYFLLAALESGKGATPFGVNVDRGGQGARIVVVPRYTAADPRTQALYARLQVTSAELGKTLGATSAVGGPAAMLADYNAAAAHRLPLIVLVLTCVTALLLAILLRSIVVALIGVVLNLLAVGATLGLLRLLFQGHAPLLGGPGEIDAVAVTAIFGVVFALSIDYQVFIVSRVREEWLRTGDAAHAVQVGLARTARVVTGAALSMLGVFLAFGLADIASLRQFGVGLAIAIVIDSTLVRLVLLPAVLHLAGDWAWWTPSFEVSGDAAPARADDVSVGQLRDPSAALPIISNGYHAMAPEGQGAKETASWPERGSSTTHDPGSTSGGWGATPDFGWTDAGWQGNPETA
ncbi:MAG TPA: MMPL family transporter [Solirubrobacteraceae bacterium]|jgi:RND superfamily putative drug exporter|nr:MMPL family transporter [Solirubrobacteraceae bacterium]